MAPTGASDSIDESEMRILARLGAALLDEWGQLSPSLQNQLVQRAKMLGANHARVKDQLAQFLREHREEDT
jgi:hypothetical protein